MADSSRAGGGRADCLVYLISPVHVISSLAALETVHPDKDVRATFLVHWPGVDEQVMAELVQIVCELTAPFGYVEQVVKISSADRDGLTAALPQSELSRALGGRLGRGRFDELYYAHDIEGGMQQLLCTAFPGARRVCYGDALGNVYQKQVHLSFLGIGSNRSGPQAPGLLRRVKSRIAALVRRFLAGLPDQGAAAPELSEFRADAASLILPVDQSGRFLEGLPLSICHRDTVLRLIASCAGASLPLRDYQSGLLGRFRDRRKYLLLTENSAEGNFIDFQRETDMYAAVIREHCDQGSVIFLKSHPGETLPRNERISASLAGDFEVVTLDPVFKRYPIELWRDLVSCSTVICMSYPVLSLKFLYGIDVIQPMDEAFIERWFPEWTWPSYRNAVSLYMQPLESLKTWDGASILWAGSSKP
jgi:hypothetical protein